MTYRPEPVELPTLEVVARRRYSKNFARPAYAMMFLTFVTMASMLVASTPSVF